MRKTSGRKLNISPADFVRRLIKTSQQLTDVRRGRLPVCLDRGNVIVLYFRFTCALGMFLALRNTRVSHLKV